MRSTYKILAYLICALVVAQAAFIVYANAGLFHWVSDDGGVLDKAFLDDESSSFPGVGGFMLHGMSGMMLIPLVALVTLVVSFFTKVKGAVAHGAAILGLVIVQVVLGLASHNVPALGPLHGINAFLIFVTALHAARLMSTAATAHAPGLGTDATVPTHTDAGTTQLQA